MSKEEKSQDITPSVGPADDGNYVDFFADWFVSQSLAPVQAWRYDRPSPTVCRRGVVVYHSSEEASLNGAQQNFQHILFMTPDAYFKAFPPNTR
jgi:hypothetical protein